MQKHWIDFLFAFTPGLSHLKEGSQVSGSDDDSVPPVGPIRIRNLEDLLRQLEKQSLPLSPSGSEDIRMSEPESDRHLYSSSGSRGHLPTAHHSYHTPAAALSALESQLVEQDLAYLLGRHLQSDRHIGIPPPPPPPQQSSASRFSDWAQSYLNCLYWSVNLSLIRSSIPLGTSKLCPYTQKIIDLQPPSPSTTTSTTTSTVHDNNREDDENGSNLDTDLSGDAAFYGSGMGGPMVRSASEEALPVSLSCDFTVSGKLNLTNADLQKLGSESINGLNSNPFNTYAVLPSHCADQTVIAGTTTATTVTSSTARTTDPIPSTSAAADAEPTTASAAADGKQLLHSPSTLDRKSTTTISRFTVTLVSQEVKTETNANDREIRDRDHRDNDRDRDRAEQRDKTDKEVPKRVDDKKKCTKKKTRKKYPEYKVWQMTGLWHRSLTQVFTDDRWLDRCFDVWKPNKLNKLNNETNQNIKSEIANN